MAIAPSSARKRTFWSSDWFHLTELAHAAVLSGLLASRRWGLGDLKFQGGTSLHLVYGSPRFSEDLDFVTASPKGLQAAMQAATAHVRAAFQREFPAIQVALKLRDDESSSEARNPRLFTVSLSEPNWHQTLKVKVEFFIVAPEASADYDANVRPLSPLRPNLKVDIPQVSLETADLVEIACDKIHALGDRNRIKERDIFDLQWICNHTGLSTDGLAAEFGTRHRTHLAMYPAGRSLAELAESLRARGAQLRSTAADDKLLTATVREISRWLPAPKGEVNPLAAPSNVVHMLGHAATCADATARTIDELLEAEVDSDVRRDEESQRG